MPHPIEATIDAVALALFIGTVAIWAAVAAQVL